MEIKMQIEDILKTLPIGYYVGREVPMKLDDKSDTSYYDLINDNIKISLKQVIDSINKFSKKSLNSFGLENIIRTNLYHEVSHSLDTPRNLFKYCYFEEDKAIMNIFEDERIETKYNGYYLNTDFDKYKRTILEFTNDDPLNAFGRFIRLHDNTFATPELIQKYKNLLVKYVNMNMILNDCYASQYKRNVKELYNEFVEQFKNSQNNTSNSNNNSSNQSKDNSDTDEPTQSDNNKLNNDNEEDNKNLNNGFDNSKESSTSSANRKKESDTFDLNIEGEINKPSRDEEDNVAFNEINKVLTRHDNRKLTEELSRIFESSNKINKANSSAINSYSGRFDPRSVVRDDYKYFLKQNRLGSARAYSKVHLNLFLDESGSMWLNEMIVNQVLRTLVKIEKSNNNFSWTWIRCSDGQEIVPRKNKECSVDAYHADGGTKLTYEIFDQFNQVQEKQCINYNLVLYDGSAPGYDYRFNRNCWEAFDKNNVVIITDPSNKSQVYGLKQAQVIVTQKYTEELIKNIISSLERLVKIF